MSLLNSFKGNIHLLSSADRIKGGRVSSVRKRKANGVKNLKHGKYSSNLHLILRCVDCPAIGECPKVSDGYCFFLLQEMKYNRIFLSRFPHL